MDAQWVYLSLLLILILLLFPLVLYLSFRKTQGKLSAAAAAALPPGRTGWPFIGESLEFVWAGMKGHPERFVFDRMAAFSSKVFRTSIMGEPTAVFCGAAGNKFLFTNESKLVTAWWPSGVNKIFPTTTQSSSSQESLKMRRQLPNFLNPQALRRHVPVMDAIARRHFADDWEGRDSVTVFPLAKRFTFWVACRLFMSVEEPSRVAEFAAPFELLASGILSMPVDLPGTRFGRAVRASRVIRKQLVEIIKQRRAELAEGKTSAEQDILSHMVAAADEEGKPIFSSDLEVADKIIGLLIGGHDTASAACTFLVKYLADFPHVYDKVYKEQMGIAKSKEEGDPLNWDDLQKMRYSWNVACEVLRLASPLPGAFREALTDFIFEGFYVPKGWKLYWSAYATHKNPKHFPDPEKFDPGRFEGKGPEPYTFVPFGGGPRMCPGKEYARLEILVFTYHLVKRFRCRNLAADGRITVNPLPAPADDLPVRLYPHPAN